MNRKEAAIGKGLLLGTSVGLGAVFVLWAHSSWAVLPCWQVLAIYGVMAGVLSGVLHKRLNANAFVAVALAVLIPLTWLGAPTFTVAGVHTIEFLLASVIGAFAVIEIVYQLFRTHIHLHTRAHWKKLAWITLLLSFVFATIERFGALPKGLWFVAMPTLALLWAATLRWLPREHTSWKPKRSVWKNSWWAVTILAILFGAWVRIAAIDSHVLQGDEYFHINAGKGYSETGLFVEWDWLNDKPQWDNPYTRAWPYTWQVAQSIELFGEEEWALRLPALLWGLAFLILLPVLVAIWTRSAAVAALTTTLAAFDPTMIWLSTFSRMYTMLFVMVLLCMHALWRAIEGQTRWRKKRSRERWAWLTLSVVLATTGYVIHPVSALLLPVIGCIVFTTWVRDRDNRWFTQVMAAMLLIAVSGAIAVLVIQPEDLHFIALRDRLELSYAAYMTDFAILPIVAGMLFVGGVLFAWRRPAQRIVLMAIATVMPILVYFIFFANRYPAKKYYGFVLFAGFIVIAWMWNEVLRRLDVSKKWASALSAVLYIWILIPFSLPGTHFPFVTEARSDRTYRQLLQHNYTVLYEYLDTSAAAGDGVILQGTKHYYLTRKDLFYYRISLETPLTIGRLEKITGEREHGYIALSRLKNQLIAPEVTKYIRENFERVKNKKIAESNFIVYKW